MGRNPERDARVRENLKQKIMDISFRIFAKKGIDAVSMNEVAAACGISYATLYRQFGTKAELITAIQSRIWQNLFGHYYRQADISTMNAAEEFGLFLNSFLDLYRNRRDFLRFNHYFNAYVHIQAVSADQMQILQEVMNTIADHFHELYGKGKRDGTLRTDIPENEIFASVTHLMLAAVTRYSVGLIYQNQSEPEKELILLRDLLFSYYTVRGAGSCPQAPDEYQNSTYAAGSPEPEN